MDSKQCTRQRRWGERKTMWTGKGCSDRKTGIGRCRYHFVSSFLSSKSSIFHVLAEHSPWVMLFVCLTLHSACCALAGRGFDWQDKHKGRKSRWQEKASRESEGGGSTRSGPEIGQKETTNSSSLSLAREKMAWHLDKCCYLLISCQRDADNHSLFLIPLPVFQSYLIPFVCESPIEFVSFLSFSITFLDQI